MRDTTIGGNAAHNLILNTNNGTNSGSITITDGAGGNIALAPNGSGKVTISGGGLNVTAAGGMPLQK